MKEIDPIKDEISKEIADTPERRLNTFDDIAKSPDSHRQIETFDDVARQGESKDSIRTFDDIAVSDKRQEHKFTESHRLDEAGEKMRQNDWLKSENWRRLDDTEKRVALDRAGHQLSETYHHPEPPLFVTSDGDRTSLGAYGDGYSYDKASDKVVGSDYRIELNKEGETRCGGKLFGDDPKEALHTYSHEFRHSYQCEQAHAFEQNLYCDNPEQAEMWSENLRDYKQPPDKSLAESDPERYQREFTAYKNQPVERDANQFADEVTNRTYKKDVEDMEVN